MAAAVQWITTEDGRRIPLGQKNPRAEARAKARQQRVRQDLPDDYEDTGPTVSDRYSHGVEIQDEGTGEPLTDKDADKIIAGLGVKGGIKEVLDAVAPSDHFDSVHVQLSPKQVRIVTSGSKGQADRMLALRNGKPICYNEGLFLEEKGTGLGTQLFSNQVEKLSAMGFKEIRTDAARSENMNGYYTWPRMGYDAPIPSPLASKLPGHLMPDNVKDSQGNVNVFRMEHNRPPLSLLMATSEGRAWWKENGEGVAVKFDLAEGSYSRRVLSAYMDERKKRGI